MATKKILMLFITLLFTHSLFAEEIKVKVTIKPPKNDGGSPIKGYFIEKKEKYAPKWERILPNWPLIPTTSSIYYVADLIHTEYDFRAIAVNKFGESEPSDPDHADLSEEAYWEVYLVCKNGATDKSTRSTTTSSFFIDFTDIKNSKPIQIPFRQEI